MQPTLAGISVLVALVIGLGVIGPAHAQTYHVYVQSMPKQWESQYGGVLAQSLDYWNKSIPGLDFQLVTQADNSDFVVEWDSKNSGDKLGYYSTNTANHYGKPVVGITLAYFEDGKLHLVQPETVMNVAEHELGNVVGVAQSTNPQDVMYPTIDDFETISAYDVTKIGGSADWHATSTKYQKLAEDTITPLQSKLDAAKAVLDANTKPSPEALIAYWWAAKYLSMADEAQTDAGASVLGGDFENAAQQFKASADFAKRAENKITIIEESLK